MENQTVHPYRRDAENEQDAILSAHATLLIKGTHRAGPDTAVRDEIDQYRGEDSAQRAARLEKKEEALAKIASIDNTPLIDDQKPLAAQIPKLKQSALPSGVGDHLNANITPLSGDDMSMLSDETIATIIKYGLEDLPNNPTSADYDKFAATRAARTEQMKRAMRPSSGRPFSISPSVTA